MKSGILAGLISALAIPVAFASEDASACQLESTQQRVDEGWGGAPAAPQTAQPTVQETRQAAATPTQRQAPPRRRSGKRIPDAELIGPRGAL